MNALPDSSVGLVDASPPAPFTPQLAQAQRLLVRPDRRNGEARAALLTRILSEYREMPGLALSPAQAARLFGLSLETCRRVLHDCVRAGWLRCTLGGVFKIAEPGP